MPISFAGPLRHPSQIWRAFARFRALSSRPGRRRSEQSVDARRRPIQSAAWTCGAPRKPR